MKFIENQEWRYATKSFDSTKKVSKSELELLKRSVQLSASSYGLQMWKVFIIEDQAIKEKLKPLSWSQNQITDCSHLFVFCNYSSVRTQDIDAFISFRSKTRGLTEEDARGESDFVTQKLMEMSDNERVCWLKRQVYIPLANLLSACAELGIDACPMEGFESADYNKVLKLGEKRLNACVIAPVGYGRRDVDLLHMTKVRRPLDELFEVL